MTLDWSEQSSHIRTLFRPWQAGDGYDEEVIAEAKARLGIRLPAVLRSFYGTWGRRSDMTSTDEYFLAPDRLVSASGALIICVENQAVCYWGVLSEALSDPNPPVVVAPAGSERTVWEIAAELAWIPSHPHLSDFLDDFTYMAAFAGGAIHGAKTGSAVPELHHREWLERGWREAHITPFFRKQYPDTPADALLGSPLHVRDGQALIWFQRFCAVAGNDDARDEIARGLGVAWEERW